jgi:dephospho-CoA kinase
LRIIGLTGGIASGKSTVAALLERCGAAVVDADQLAREVVEPGGEALAAIVREFGDKVLNSDGTLNRAALGEIVFAEPAARKMLEGITHPAIRKRANERLARLEEAGVEIAIYMAPLIFEAGLAGNFQEIWVVYLDPETQLERLMARDGLGEEGARARIASQMPMEEKRRLGDVVIDNSGSREELEAQIQRLWRDEVLGRPAKGL